jgi:methylated-DNA-[protein]-cysteine S-methyltransferase
MARPVLFLTETLLTPIGKLVLISDENGLLRATDWMDYDDRMRRLLACHYGKNNVMLMPSPRSSGSASAIAAYFDGDLHAIDSLQTVTEGTPFQKCVWQALREVPAGQTVSYGALAKHIGKPAAVRAVGLANGANPIGIVVPCHRVIGADGSLTGYGGGLERKRWLLDHEKQAITGGTTSTVSRRTDRQDGTMRLFF